MAILLLISAHICPASSHRWNRTKQHTHSSISLTYTQNASTVVTNAAGILYNEERGYFTPDYDTFHTAARTYNTPTIAAGADAASFFGACGPA